MTKVMIGIQARSTSRRLPRKAFELIDGKMMLDWVIDSCKIAAAHIDKKLNVPVDVVVVTPTGDPIVNEFCRRAEVIEGDEYDVLGRYHDAVRAKNPDYIIRITGDCPMIPSFIISNLMGLAITRGYDYISNADERFRTALDGADCEVVSRKLFEVMAEEARTAYDREHVTPWIRRNPPMWARLGIALNHFDHSNIKLSVDTKEDLENVRSAFDRAGFKYREAVKFYGMAAVHRL